MFKDMVPFDRGRLKGYRSRSSSGATPSVLWIHGYTLDTTCWRSCWRMLPGYSHLGFDMPRHGRSDPAAEYHSMSDLAGELISVAEYEGVTHLVGLSFGAIVALEVLSRAPGLFQSVLLGSASVPNSPPDPDARSTYKQLMGLFDRGAPNETIVESWLAPANPIFSSIRKYPSLQREIISIVSRHGWSELGDNFMLNFIRQSDCGWSPLNSMGTRVVVAYGENDTETFITQAKEVAGRISGAHLLKIAATGHLCLLERPDAVSRLLTSSGYGAC